MEAAFRRLESLGCRNVLIWTLEENIAARSFYEKLGGVIIGKDTRNFGGKALTELAYGWKNAKLVPAYAFQDRLA